MRVSRHWPRATWHDRGVSVLLSPPWVLCLRSAVIAMAITGWLITARMLRGITAPDDGAALFSRRRPGAGRVEMAADDQACAAQFARRLGSSRRHRHHGAGAGQPVLHRCRASSRRVPNGAPPSPAPAAAFPTAWWTGSSFRVQRLPSLIAFGLLGDIILGSAAILLEGNRDEDSTSLCRTQLP